MRYIIITRKTVRNIKIISILILIIIMSFFIIKSLKPKTVKTFSSSDILKEQLPNEDITTKEEIVDKIVGFKFSKPKTIIEQTLPDTSNNTIDTSEKPAKETHVESPSETTEPETVPTAKPTPTPQKQIVEERNIITQSMLKNQTNYNVTLSDFENRALNLSSSPKVLIIHTHTTESYAPENESEYFVNDSSRSCDNERNMISIGKIIGEALKEQGIEVIHDETFHDYPVYNGAYGRCLSSISNDLEKYPGINIILDVHRDAVSGADGKQIKVISDISGQKTAQVMLVVGTNGGGLSHSGWKDNLTFATHIQKNAEKNYPGLMRPLNLREERFNQHMTPNSIIIEVGTNANTLSEAKAGARLIGECIAAVLTT